MRRLSIPKLLIGHDHRSLVLIVATLALALAGCGGDGYPSLALRPAELVGPPPPGAAIAPTPGTADPALAARLLALLNKADAGQRAYLAWLPAARAKVDAAQRAPLTSDAWSAANAALSRLEAAATPTSAALAKLEAIDSQDRVAHAPRDGAAGPANPRPDAVAIAGANARIAALVASQNAEIAALEQALVR